MRSGSKVCFFQRWILIRVELALFKKHEESIKHCLPLCHSDFEWWIKQAPESLHWVYLEWAEFITQEEKVPSVCGHFVQPSSVGRFLMEVDRKGYCLWFQTSSPHGWDSSFPCALWWASRQLTTFLCPSSFPLHQASGAWIHLWPLSGRPLNQQRTQMTSYPLSWPVWTILSCRTIQASR